MYIKRHIERIYEVSLILHIAQILPVLTYMSRKRLLELNIQDLSLRPSPADIFIFNRTSLMMFISPRTFNSSVSAFSFSSLTFLYFLDYWFIFCFIIIFNAVHWNISLFCIIWIFKMINICTTFEDKKNMLFLKCDSCTMQY